MEYLNHFDINMVWDSFCYFSKNITKARREKKGKERKKGESNFDKGFACALLFFGVYFLGCAVLVTLCKSERKREQSKARKGEWESKRAKECLLFIMD